MEATRKSQFGNGFRLTTCILARPNKSLVVRVIWQKNKNKNIKKIKKNLRVGAIKTKYRGF